MGPARTLVTALLLLRWHGSPAVESIRWHGFRAEPPPSTRRAHAGDALVVDPALCFETEVALVEMLFFTEAAGPCMHVAEVQHLQNGSIHVKLLEFVEAVAPGRQLTNLRGHSLASHGASCFGFALVGREAGGCGVVYAELPEDDEGASVAEYLWNAEMESVRLNPGWPFVQEKRLFSLAAKVLPLSDENRRHASAFMAKPAWSALRDALESTEDWLSDDLSTRIDEVDKLMQEEDGTVTVVVELGMYSAVDAFIAPGSVEEDVRALGFFAITTYRLLETMRSWQDVEAHLEFARSLVGSIKTVWGSEFALSEHRGWVPGMGYWDAAAILLGSYWPEGTHPRSRAAGSELIALLRASGAPHPAAAELGLEIPLPLPAISWWPAPANFDPLTLPSQLANRHGLNVIIIEEHRIDYQELRALLARVSKDLFDKPARFHSYFLQEEDPVGVEIRPEEWDSLGRPGLRGDLQHLYLEQGMEAGFAEAIRWTDGPEWQDADLVAGCTPLWACMALLRVMPRLHFIARQNMALLQFVMDWKNLPIYWELLREFMLSPKVSLAWKHRLGCEQVFDQTGARPAYVPLIGLHTEGHKYQPTKPDVLVHRCSHRGFSQLLYFLRGAAAEVPDVKLDFLTDLQLVHKKFLTWREFTEYTAIVLIPHVPNTISFADVYAMHIPIFLPDEPEIWTWTWSQSDPYAGPGFPEKQQKAPWDLSAQAPAWWKEAKGDVKHPFGAFDHLRSEFAMEYFVDRAYWYQYTEYHLLPYTRRFRGIANLLKQLQDYRPEDAIFDSRRIASEQLKREVLVISWMSTTVAQALTHGGA